MVLKRMITERLVSVLLLNNDVFLKRIRFLLFDEAYTSRKYSFKLKTNHIYDLSFSKDKRHEFSKVPFAPSISMQIVAQQAFKMPTTLWYDRSNQKKDTMATVIACGQFSTCFNLMEYIYRIKNNANKKLYNNLSPAYKSKVDHLEQRLQSDLDKFKVDPFWLYNENGKAYAIDNFKIATVNNANIPKEFKGLRNT